MPAAEDVPGEIALRVELERFVGCGLDPGRGLRLLPGSLERQQFAIADRDFELRVGVVWRDRCRAFRVAQRNPAEPELFLARGDIHGFVSEFNPGTSPNYNLWFIGYKNVEMWRLVGNGQITLDPKKRLPMYKKLQDILLTEVLEIPLMVPYKYQVVSKRLKNMYVAYSDFNTGLRTAYIVS